MRIREFVDRVGGLFSWLRTTALDPVGGLGILLATLGSILFLLFLFLSLPSEITPSPLG